MNLNDLYLAAALAGVRPEEVLSFADRGDTFAVVVQPGPKYVFTREEVEKKRAELEAASARSAVAEEAAPGTEVDALKKPSRKRSNKP